LQEGENVYGLLNSVPSPMLCEMHAFAGFDFVILDLEHLLRSEEDLMHCVRACEAAGISPWLRIPQLDEKLIGRALDAGIARCGALAGFAVFSQVKTGGCCTRH
jgi:4-hydroxy-2-oxoheptanedioate aldolase